MAQGASNTQGYESRGGSPDSFATPVQEIVQASAPGQYTPAHADIIGGGSIGRPGRGAVDNSFKERGERGMIESLAGLANTLMAPKIKEARQKAAAEGAIAALQGKSATDLAKDDTFHSVFGDSAYVAAARSVEATTKVSAGMTDIQSNMGEYSKLSPAEFRAKLPEIIEANRTGDPLTDAAVTSAWMERLPSIVDTHTRAFMERRDAQALNVWYQGAKQAGSEYEATSKSKIASDDVKAESKARYLDHVGTTLSTLKPEQAGKAAFNLVRDLMTDYKWGAVDALQEAGLYNHMTPEQMQALDRHKEQARQEMYRKDPAYAIQYEDTGKFEARVMAGTASENEIRKFFTKKNAENPEFLQNTWVEQQFRIRANAIEQRQREYARLGAAKQDALISRMAFSQMWASPGALANPTAHTAKQVEEFSNEMYAATLKSDDPSQLRQFFSFNVVNQAKLPPAAQNDIAGVLSALDSNGTYDPVSTPRSMRLLHTVGTLPGGKSLLIRTFGEEQAGKMLRVLEAGVPMPTAPMGTAEYAKQAGEFRTGMQAVNDGRYGSQTGGSGPDEKKIRSEVRSQLERRWLFGGPTNNVVMNETAINRTVEQMVPRVIALSKNSGAGDIVTLTKDVLSARVPKLTVVSGIAARVSPGDEGLFQSELVRQMSDDVKAQGGMLGPNDTKPFSAQAFDRSVQATVARKLGTKDYEITDIQQITSLGRNANARLSVQVRYNDGRPGYIEVSPAEVLGDAQVEWQKQDKYQQEKPKTAREAQALYRERLSTQ